MNDTDYKFEEEIRVVGNRWKSTYVVDLFG
jgi:hypothetical protein